jgi:hypothetical protein
MYIRGTYVARQQPSNELFATSRNIETSKRLLLLLTYHSYVHPCFSEKISFYTYLFIKISSKPIEAETSDRHRNAYESLDFRAKVAEKAAIKHRFEPTILVPRRKGLNDFDEIFSMYTTGVNPEESIFYIFIARPSTGKPNLLTRRKIQVVRSSSKEVVAF